MRPNQKQLWVQAFKSPDFLLVGLPRMLLVAGRLWRDMRGPTLCSFPPKQRLCVIVQWFLWRVFCIWGDEYEKIEAEHTIRERNRTKITPNVSVFHVYRFKTIIFLLSSRVKPSGAGWWSVEVAATVDRRPNQSCTRTPVSSPWTNSYGFTRTDESKRSERRSIKKGQFGFSEVEKLWTFPRQNLLYTHVFTSLSDRSLLRNYFFSTSVFLSGSDSWSVFEMLYDVSAVRDHFLPVRPKLIGFTFMCWTFSWVFEVFVDTMLNSEVGLHVKSFLQRRRRTCKLKLLCAEKKTRLIYQGCRIWIIYQL